MISDERLTLYFYNDELTEHERNDIATALAGDVTLARRYQALSDDLNLLRALPAIKLPDEAAVLMHYEIDRAGTGVRQSWKVPGLFAAAAALVLGIAIGINLQRPAAVDTPQQAQTVPSAGARTPALAGTKHDAFSRGLASYMAASQHHLTQLAQTDPADRIVLIGQIIDQNRAFERAAENNGAADLARVLRAFEQLLTGLAQTQLSRRDVADGADQLSFEFAAMLTRLSASASKEPYTL